MKLVLLVTFVAFATFQCGANGIQVSNVSIVNPDPANNYTFVQFDLSWNNSWRTSTFEANHDAAWIFIKYRLLSENYWQHATLTTGAHVAPTGSIIDGVADGMGVFVRRSDFSIGNVSWTSLQLRWDYGADGLQDYSTVEIAAFAIEMVYVPNGAFYVGDGAHTIAGQFENGTGNSPYQITSENSITLGGSGSNLGNNNNVNMSVADDFSDAASQNLPGAFPKGFQAFYCMKYELSQEQYVAFLNLLTRTQQQARANVSVAGRFMSNETGWSSTPQYRNGVRLQSDAGNPNPRVFGNDLNTNGSYGESTDGQNIPCNWISIADYLAYLDWSGLRPMTELEYEKACRGGNLFPFHDEYAWGNTILTGANGISNAGATNEASSNAANCTFNNAASVQGPIRTGSYAQSASSREDTGATYYGIMEMSGNTWEYCVKVGSSAGRNFTGSHGDGELNAAGDKTNSDWGNDSGSSHAIGLRGSDWLGVDINWLTVSGRHFANWNADADTRFSTTSIRGVRTAP